MCMIFYSQEECYNGDEREDISMKEFSHLFSPIKVGETVVKNRVFMPPISTNLADKGYVTDALVAHYAARAKGGVGLIVTEVTTVEPTYIYLPGDMSIHDDSFIPGWKKLTEAVHQYDCKILPQLFHPAYMAFPIPGTPRLIAPSNVGPYYAKEAPRSVTKEELKVIIKQFGEAALRVKTAGADGVEIHAAHALWRKHPLPSDDPGSSWSSRNNAGALCEPLPQGLPAALLPAPADYPCAGSTDPRNPSAAGSDFLPHLYEDSRDLPVSTAYYQWEDDSLCLKGSPDPFFP